MIKDKAKEQLFKVKNRHLLKEVLARREVLSNRQDGTMNSLDNWRWTQRCSSYPVGLGVWVKKRGFEILVHLPLRLFKLEKCSAGAFAATFRVLSRKI